MPLLCCSNERPLPLRWKFTITGFANGTCSECSAFDGDYICERPISANCWFWVGPGGFTACNFWEPVAYVWVDEDTDGTLKVTGKFVNTNTSQPLLEEATYELDGVLDLLSGPLTLTKTISYEDQCSFPSTVTVDGSIGGPTTVNELITSCLSDITGGPPCNCGAVETGGLFPGLQLGEAADQVLSAVYASLSSEAPMPTTLVQADEPECPCAGRTAP